VTGASTILYWEMMGKDYWLNDGNRPFPAFEVIRQLDESLPPGSTIVETSNNTETLTSFAARTPAGFMVHIINASPEPMIVRIEGFPDGEYRHVQSVEGSMNLVEEGYTAKDGVMEVKLVGSSVNVLRNEQ